MIKVATQGGETKEIAYREGMKVGDALKAAGIELAKNATLSVNGKDAKPGNLMADSALVVVTPKIKNG